MTIFISLLFTATTLITQVKDSSYKIKDSCKIEFINKLFTAYINVEGYWCVTNVSDCDTGWKSNKKLVSLKDIYQNNKFLIQKKAIDSLKYLTFIISKSTGKIAEIFLRIALLSN